MNEEILAGIKNAIERGYSLEQAVQSFINAGYNAMEVRNIAETFSTGASTLTLNNAPGKKQVISDQSTNKIFNTEGENNNAPSNSQNNEKSVILPNRDIPTQTQQVDLSPRTKDNVAGYIPKKKRDIGLIIIMSSFLLLLVAGLIFVLINRDSVMNYINGLIGK